MHSMVVLSQMQSLGLVQERVPAANWQMRSNADLQNAHYQQRATSAPEEAQFVKAGAVRAKEDAPVSGARGPAGASGQGEHWQETKGHICSQNKSAQGEQGYAASIQKLAAPIPVGLVRTGGPSMKRC